MKAATRQAPKQLKQRKMQHQASQLAAAAAHLLGDWSGLTLVGVDVLLGRSSMVPRREAPPRLEPQLRALPLAAAARSLLAPAARGEEAPLAPPPTLPAPPAITDKVSCEAFAGIRLL